MTEVVTSMWTYISNSWGSVTLLCSHLSLHFCPSLKPAVSMCGTCGTNYISAVAHRCVMVEGTFAALCPGAVPRCSCSHGAPAANSAQQMCPGCGGIKAAAQVPIPFKPWTVVKLSAQTQTAVSHITWTHPFQEQREVPLTEHMETTFNLRLRLTLPGMKFVCGSGHLMACCPQVCCCRALSVVPGACTRLFSPVTDLAPLGAKLSRLSS